MSCDLDIETQSPEVIPPDILDMCNAAYEEDLTTLLGDLGAATHAIGRVDGRIVSHAMWVRHDLQPHGCKRLATAYIEAVATLQGYRRNGHATRVLQHLIRSLPDYIELAALCPAEAGLYEKAGWQFWRGPLRVRMPAGEIIDTPDERIMIMRLPKTPPLDLDQPILADWRPGEVW